MIIHLIVRTFCRWVELRSIEQEQGGMPPLYIEKAGYISHPSDYTEERLKLLLRHARLQNMTYENTPRGGG